MALKLTLNEIRTVSRKHNFFPFQSSGFESGFFVGHYIFELSEINEIFIFVDIQELA